MDLEEFVEGAVETCEKVKDMATFSPAARKAMAAKYSHYAAYSLLAAFPLCLPVSDKPALFAVYDRREQPALVVMTSTGPFVGVVQVASGAFKTTTSGNTFILP